MVPLFGRGEHVGRAGEPGEPPGEEGAFVAAGEELRCLRRHEQAEAEGAGRGDPGGKVAEPALVGHDDGRLAVGRRAHDVPPRPPGPGPVVPRWNRLDGSTHDDVQLGAVRLHVGAYETRGHVVPV